ncbi:hypothetical protein M1373_03365 [Candidatus Marsarchaeota archaeon]|nr:hypothetical protein [Candidatus Marsarchaeota archaeon]MCL5404784.1 hypothetical protein [Candidatus Marsarchaeota archaeon]
MLSSKAAMVISKGSVKIRVKRAGMLQMITFSVKRVEIGGAKFVELYSSRHIELDELARIANDVGLPVEAEDKRAFPKGTGAKDFIGL